MPLKQGRKPCVVVGARDHRRLRGTLLNMGYQFHRGLRSRRPGEIEAWLADIGRGRQVHVQEVKRRNGGIAIYAHTEPASGTMAHAVSALLDGASFQGGSRVLRADLREDGWKFRGSRASKP